ncbi:hypothetical protein IT568_03835 [bacterium]|nr:hypothetical protein [bacterium]
METKISTKNPHYSYTPITDVSENFINGQRVGTAENILKTIDVASGLLAIQNINHPVVHSGHSIIYHKPVLIGNNTGVYSRIVRQEGNFIALANEVFSGKLTTESRLERLVKGHRKWTGIALCVPIDEKGNGIFKQVRLPEKPEIFRQNEVDTFSQKAKETIELHRKIIKNWVKNGESLIFLPQNTSEAGENHFPTWNSHLAPSQANPLFIQFGGEILRQTDIASDIVSSNFVGEKTIHLGQTDIFIAPVAVNEILRKKVCVVYTTEKLIVVAQEVYGHFPNEKEQTLRSLSLAISGIVDFDGKLKILKQDQRLKFSPSDEKSNLVKQFSELAEFVIEYQRNFLKILKD